jgi:hypothetical protein
MKKLILSASIAALGFAAMTGAASAQQSIAGETNYVSPVPFFKDLKPWDPAYKAPRTLDGKPDLQGVWSNASLTTMTRSGRGPSGGLVIPQEMIDDLTENSYYNQRLRNDQQRTDETATAGDGKGGGDVKGYNNFWIDPGSEYAKVNGQYRSSWIVTPESGQVPFSAEGRAARGARMASVRGSSNTGPEIRSIGDRCLISFGSNAGPPLTNAMYNNHYQIVQTPSHVMINTEMNHDVRVVTLVDKPDNAQRRPAAVKQWMGDAIGWWEGDTLVVETRNVHPIQERAGAYPISEQGKVTERFTRVSDAEIFYQFTVEDPTYYSQAWSGEVPMRKSNEALYEYACHEGNYALPGILRGMAIGLDTAIESEGE